MKPQKQRKLFHFITSITLYSAQVFIDTTALQSKPPKYAVYKLFFVTKHYSRCLVREDQSQESLCMKLSACVYFRAGGVGLDKQSKEVFLINSIFLFKAKISYSLCFYFSSLSIWFNVVLYFSHRLYIKDGQKQ